MSVWLTIPSARPFEEAESVLKLWKERGYKIALWRDDFEPTTDGFYRIGPFGAIADALDGYGMPYPGYGRAVNKLIRGIIVHDPEAQWFVTGGDDTEPDDLNSAEQIALQCEEHFINRNACAAYVFGEFDVYQTKRVATFGVMQPTGDRFNEGSIDRICGSPWIGREFALRTYGGNGPYWPEYTHMFVDEELQEVALKLGVLWQRRDLIHLHHHYTRIEGTDSGTDRPTPEHLKKWNTLAHWKEMQAIFQERKAKGFPGHEVT